MAAGGAGGSAAMGGSGGQGGEPVDPCVVAADPLPEGLTVLSHVTGAPASHIRAQDWAITLYGTTYEYATEPMSEAVRFELEHPARIYGFEVQWSNIPEGAAPETQLAAAIHPDFGYDGYNFWPEPAWEGVRCLQDVTEGQWVSYALAEPMEIDHPGLVYVAHFGPDGQSPAWLFDDVYVDDCGPFDACPNVINMPGVEPNTFFNGASLSFPYAFMVRLHLEYLDDVAPDDKFFQEVDPSPSHSQVSWGDYDNDGWDDLLLGGRFLHRNDGNGSFTDVTDDSGLTAIQPLGHGGVWGDYDNDGCLDLFIWAHSFTEADKLLRSNCDGTFTDVTAGSGIVDQQNYNDCGDPQNIRSPTLAAAWFDLDSDGLIDLYVANYECGADHTWYRDDIYRNNGDGTFTELGPGQGFEDDLLAGRNVSPIDHDDDGDVDLFVGNYRLNVNRFYENDGDGSVTERGHMAGLTGEPVQVGLSINYGHTIGSAWGDLNNDGFFDMIHANLAHPLFYHFSDKTQVLLNQGDGTYEDLSGDWSFPASDAGVRYQETHSVPALADFDQDGVLDLVITATYDGRPTDFYWGDGDGTFTLDAYHAGITTEGGWGASAADFDHDGDLDLFATTLFENQLTNTGHWLQVRAVGNVASNWAALGATVQVTANGTTWRRHVQGGTGQGGQDSMYLHFGLGADDSVDSIAVAFPGGADVLVSGPIAADQRVWVYEDGSHTLGWAP